jgi:hypothetical protein
MKSREREEDEDWTSQILQVRDMKIWDTTGIYKSGRISRDTDKGIATKARYPSTCVARSGNSPWKLGLGIVIVEIKDHDISNIVICIEPDWIFEIWPPIYRGQERPARDRLRLS